ncbi:MAG: glycosyltransferase family 39 protein [Planctomycetota bacterium]|nr:glycosyltransferase family 39 protein [Planctomycetota bacterium]
MEQPTNPISSEARMQALSPPGFRWQLTALFVLIVIVHLVTYAPGHSWGDDFAMYIMEGQSLVEGRSMMETGYVPNPHNPDIGPVAYPPVLPAILAPVIAIRGVDIAALKLVGVVLSLLLVVLAYATFSPYLGWCGRLAFLAVVGLNPFILELKTSINSDIPFAAFVFASILLMDRAYRTVDGEQTPKSYLLLLAGVAMYLAYGTRNIGIVLPAVLLANDVIQRGWPRNGLFRGIVPSPAAMSACAIFAVGYFAQKYYLDNEGSYVDLVKFDPFLPVKNLGFYTQRLAGFFNNGYSKPAAAVLFAGLSVLALIGLWRHLRQGIRSFDLLVPAYMAPLLIWPTHLSVPRYILPLVPVFMFYMIRGALSVQVFGSFASRRILIGVVLLLVGLSYGFRLYAFGFEAPEQGIHRPATQELFAFIRENTAAENRVVFTKPRALALFTGRKALVYSDVDTPEANEELYDSLGVRWLIVPANEEVFAETGIPEQQARYSNWINRHQSWLQKVYTNDDFIVYRWLSKAERGG